MAELGVAGFIQIFLQVTGLTAIKLPSWLEEYAELITLESTIAFLILLGLLRSVSQYFTNQSSLAVRELTNAHLRSQCSTELLRPKFTKFLRNAEVVTRFNEIFPKAGVFIYHLNRIFVLGIQCTALVAGMLVIAWREALISMSFLLLIAATMYLLNRHLKTITKDLPKISKELNASIERVVKNFIFVRISRTEALEQQKLSSGIGLYLDKQMKAGALTNSSASLAPFLGIVMIAIDILLSQKYLNTPPETLLAFLYLFIRFVQQLAVIVNDYGYAHSHLPHFNAADLFLDSLASTTTSRPAADSDLNYSESFAPALAPEILFKGVSFRWPSGPTIIDDFDLHLPRGRSIGIFGKSGSGKSTLLMMALGILEPHKGKILVGKLSPQEYYDSSYLNTGYVGVESFLVSGSIRSNLEYGLHRRASDQEIKGALQGASLWDEVCGLSGGIDHVLGDHGAGLSSGQKQRLAFARALLKKPSLLILDEATSNLDLGTEADLIKALEQLRGKTTVLLVSHREVFRSKVDDVVYLG